MWTTFVNGFQSSIRFDRSSPTIINFGNFCYYTSSPSLRFGGTCARKGFRQDLGNSVSTQFKYESHLLSSMGHSQRISNKHYADQNAYNRDVPQNILQNSIYTDIALSIIAKRKVSPAHIKMSIFWIRLKLQKLNLLCHLWNFWRNIQKLNIILSIFALEMDVLSLLSMKVIGVNIWVHVSQWYGFVVGVIMDSNIKPTVIFLNTYATITVSRNLMFLLRRMLWCTGKISVVTVVEVSLQGYPGKITLN